MPNKWTFLIPPIADLLVKYVNGGKGWIDPFAGMHSPAEITNDFNPDMPTKFHMDALEFCKQLDSKYVGVLFDPPYSYRQVKECYNRIGLNPTKIDTSINFYRRIINAVYEKINVNGFAISCGWNSIGFGKRRGFEIVEILLVCHGQHHNDTIVTVERKIQHSFPVGKIY